MRAKTVARGGLGTRLEGGTGFLCHFWWGSNFPDRPGMGRIGLVFTGCGNWVCVVFIRAQMSLTLEAAISTFGRSYYQGFGIGSRVTMYV